MSEPDLQYIGYQRKTAQALSARRTSSTHWSSNVIHCGLSSILLGLTRSQKSSPRTFLILFQKFSHTSPWLTNYHVANNSRGNHTHSVNGFHDHFPFKASDQSFRAFTTTDPVGGVTSYLLRHKNRTSGQKQNITVGRRNESQNPTYFSA